jgi:hypothetical protein
MPQMASSGRMPREIVALMNRTIEVSISTDTNEEGRQRASAWREVRCYIAPGTDVTQTHEVKESNPRGVAYCDDVDITEFDLVRVAGFELPINAIETYDDEAGQKMYQVVSLG